MQFFLTPLLLLSLIPLVVPASRLLQPSAFDFPSVRGELLRNVGPIVEKKRLPREIMRDYLRLCEMPR